MTRRVYRKAVPEDKEILNAEQAGAVLGISTRLVLRLARDGEIPGQKLGREWRFLRSALRSYLGGESEAAAISAALKKSGVEHTVKRGRG
jgi:excisionase family DNA binding protein